MTDKRGAARRRRRFIEYARVSKVGDRGDDLQSPELQVRDMDAYALRNNIEVVDRITDLDKTGRSFEKRAITNIITRIRAGEVDGVLLHKWSRWGRDQLESKLYIKEVQTAGGEVQASSEPFDAKTSIGKFSRDMALSIAELQSNQISDGWKAVQARRIERGLTHGGLPPFGYTMPERRGDPFRPHPVNADVVREMYARYLRGQGPQSIVSWLNNEVHAVPSGRGKKRGDETVRPFIMASVVTILDSGFAAGFITVAGGHRKGAHEPLIDGTTWSAYQRERDKRRRVHPKARQPRWYLGGGLTVCGRCGGNMVVNSYTARDSMAICSTYRVRRTCPGVWMNRVRLETIVALWLGGHVTEWADRQDEMLGADDERAQLAKQLEVARADHDRLAQGRRDALELVNRGLASIDDFQARAAEVDAERDALDIRISSLQAQLDALSPDADAYDRIARGAEGQTSEEWNAVLKRVIRRVVVTRETVTIEPWRGEPSVITRVSHRTK
jgi:site-specific DNA recombinase